MVLPSDGVWIIHVTDPACGEPCDLVTTNLQKIVAQEGGSVYNIAMLTTKDVIQGKDGEMLEVYKHFNVTSLPLIILL